MRRRSAQQVIWRPTADSRPLYEPVRQRVMTASLFRVREPVGGSPTSPSATVRPHPLADEQPNVGALIPLWSQIRVSHAEAATAYYYL